jgi:tetratricopeptide (TPR) repeat protein
LVFLAHEGLALALEAQGKLDDALAAVEAVVGETGDFYRDQALWHKARVLEAQGKADEALAVYETYVTEYPAESGPLAMAKVHARVRELKPELLEVKPSAPAEAIVDDGEQAPAGGAQAPEGGGPEDSAPPAAGAEVEP